jgi:hypothetical protein
MTYRGPYALMEVEAVAGDFTQVLMRPVATVVSGPQAMQLTTIGLRWPCGCETRGTGTPASLPACVLAACDEHVGLVGERPERPAAIGFDDPEPWIVPREIATGRILIVRAGPDGAAN